MRNMSPCRGTFNSTRSAFTLTEILIVVVLLGILAAIVVPRYVNASNEANDSATRRALQVIRYQIGHYRAREIAEPALIANQWDDLYQGDYLHTIPINPWNHSSTIAAAAAVGVGWVWRDNGYGVNQIFATDDNYAERVE